MHLPSKSYHPFRLHSLLGTAFQLATESLLVTLLLNPVVAQADSLPTDTTPAILIITEGNDTAEQIIEELLSEIQPSFRVRDCVIDSTTTSARIASVIHRSAPMLVLCIGDRAIDLYADYQADISAGKNIIPSLSILSSDIRRKVSDMQHAVGITNEVPIVTSIVNLRSLLHVPVRRVGIIHRPGLREFIDENKELCRREQIQLACEEIANDEKKLVRRIRKSIRRLVVGKKVDVLWLPSDPALLNPTTITRAVAPLVQRYHIPVVVGLDKFVRGDNDFGTFAVYPDYLAFVLQITNLIEEIATRKPEQIHSRIVPPVSVCKIVNCSRVKKEDLPLDINRNVAAVACAN